MKFIDLKKVKDGQYLKNYEVTYLNKAGKEKTYEMVSREDILTPDDLSASVSGVSVAAYQDGKLLLLREFRMSINKTIFNLCAGMMEQGETLEECVKRELYEESGLRVKRFLKVLPPSYAAVGISNTKTHIVFVETEGSITDHTSENENIHAAFYSKAEVKKLLETEEFSSQLQLTAYFFANCQGNLDNNDR